MGYSDISIEGSDTASDLDYEVRNAKTKEAAFKKLQKEARQDHGPYNTCGWVNVAMVLTEGSARWLEHTYMKMLISDTIRLLEEENKNFKKNCDFEGLEDHIVRNRELIRKLKKRLNE